MLHLLFEQLIYKTLITNIYSDGSIETYMYIFNKLTIDDSD